MEPLDLIPVRDVPWLRDRTVYLVRHGSQAYGTSTPTSDLDLRACAVPPAPYLLGYLNRFEQAVFKEPHDLTVFSLHKFAKLAADGNPNVLELLYVDDEDVLYASEVGKVLRDNRHLFLSKKVKHTMTGYAHAQLKRINLHRAYLLNPPKKPPVRSDYDLPERTVIPADQLATATSLIKKQVESWQLSLDGIDDASRIEFEGRIARVLTEMQLTSDAQWTAAGRVIGLSENFLAILDRERAYASAKAQWDQYQQWKRERNPVRAAMEAESGFDRKHGMHLIRLMRMCLETLTTGTVNVRRPDAKELLEIRNGSMTYDALIAEADKISAEVEVAYTTSTLPKEPDRAAIDEIVIECTNSMMY